MESYKKSSTIVVLKLTEEEADWLKGVMQNPLTDNYDTEDEQTKKFREKFFNALCLPTNKDK